MKNTSTPQKLNDNLIKKFGMPNIIIFPETLTAEQERAIEANRIECLDCVEELFSTCPDWTVEQLSKLVALHKEFHDEILKGE